jgi:hypothetical protein
MKINYRKSELIPVGMVDEELTFFTSIVGCDVGNFLSNT